MEGAKNLLKHGSLEKYIKSFIDDGDFEMLATHIYDDNWENVKEGIISEGEDMGDHDPIYDDWEEFLDDEREEVIDSMTDNMLRKYNIDSYILSNYQGEVYEIIKEEVKNFVNHFGGDLFR